MSGPHKALAAAVAVSLLSALGLWSLRCAPAGRAPHVVLVVIDTLRWDALGYNGNPHDTSPRIDRIAADGVRFNQAISSSGWTLPAMGSLLTGTWPLIHGGLGKKTILSPIRDEVPTAAEVLQAAGFRTIGLANAAFVSPSLGMARGFDSFDHHNAYNRDIRRADETITEALRLIAESRDEPSFVLIHLYDPHLDYDPPPAYADRFTGGRTGPPPPLRGKTCRETVDVAGGMAAETIAYIEGVYLGEVAFVDEQVGRLVDGLVELGIYDQTTLIITSDHGEEFWEHGGFEHGHTLYDELIHIPLVLKLPAGVEAVERSIDAQVRILDILPTVFDLLGVEQPESFIGSSLLPLVRGEDRADRVAYSESTLYGEDRISWRGSRYKYIYDMDTTKQRQAELYDWKADPAERHDLLDSHPEVAQRMLDELKVFGRALNREAAEMSDLRPASFEPEQKEALKSLGYIN